MPNTSKLNPKWGKEHLRMKPFDFDGFWDRFWEPRSSCLGAASIGKFINAQLNAKTTIMIIYTKMRQIICQQLCKHRCRSRASTDRVVERQRVAKVKEEWSLYTSQDKSPRHAVGPKAWGLYQFFGKHSPKQFPTHEPQHSNKNNMETQWPPRYHNTT